MYCLFCLNVKLKILRLQSQTEMLENEWWVDFLFYL